MQVERVEKHILKHNLKEIDELCFNSKNLYNYCNYILRQSFIQTGKLPKEYELSKQLTKDKQRDWVKMGANTNQQILKLLYKNWKSFFEAIKEYKKNPSKFRGRPKLPKYKDKEKGRNIVIITCSTNRIHNGFFYFPKFTKIEPIKTFVTNKNLAQARIVPQTNCYILEIVYKITIPDNKVSADNVLSIDLGINNLATCFDKENNSSFIISGKNIKSFNQFYNKQNAKLKSTTKIVNDKETSKRLKRLSLKRENKIIDYFHKSTKYIIDYCITHDIGKVIVGHNKNWKQNSNLGKINNQNFIQIPFNKFIGQLKYKCENIGLEFILTEESYSSKVDHYAKEEMKHQENYLGKRKKRGLFQSSKGFEINADVNGAIGIMRKVISNSEFNQIVDRGVVITPNRINIYSK